MNPIYFPFTFVAAPIAEMLSACFRPVVVYQPSERNVPEAMRLLGKQGVLSIQVPIKGEEDRFEKICRDYFAWIDVHGGSELEYLKTQKDRIPFFNESSSLQVREEIQKKLRDSKTEEKLSPLFSARLFLHLAQDHDMKIWDIHHGLVSVGQMEQELMGRLRGENAASDPGHDAMAQGYGLDDDKMAERLRAWGLLYLHDEAQRDAAASGVFLTTSRSALELLLEKSSEFYEVLRIDSTTDVVNKGTSETRWRDCLSEKLVRMATTPWALLQQDPETVMNTDHDGLGVSLTIFLIPGVSPRGFFSRMVKLDRDETKGEDETFKNTIVGLIET
jgi:hypothetical protein